MGYRAVPVTEHRWPAPPVGWAVYRSYQRPQLGEFLTLEAADEYMASLPPDRRPPPRNADPTQEFPIAVFRSRPWLA